MIGTGERAFNPGARPGTDYNPAPAEAPEPHMPELRQNIATREWVIIATERARRPDQFVDPKHALTETRPAHVAGCPFCVGNEHLTDAPTLVLPEQGAWQVRVVPNKFPALAQGEGLDRDFEGVRRRMSGFGVHEVLVDAPQHNATTALQTEQQVALGLGALATRGRALARDKRVQITVTFKNHGASAGMSLEHPHSQMLSLPVVPNHVRERLRDAAAHFDEAGTCVFCDMWREELGLGSRVILENEHFVAFVPYAAFSPFHTWIVPKRHMPLFIQTEPAELEALGAALRSVLRSFYFGLHDPDFNFVVRSAPYHEERSQSFHWYLSVVPRLTRTAGFEIGSGMYINTSLPEDSARFLREVPEGRS